MRLKSIKLIGFKSFVDPTKVELPCKITAIVGPNGCGKSNIIDAVRWVMGEASAKQLRGESMADVIFNGSSKRSPLDQAAIELHFDNTLGRLGGEYNSYSELIIRRQVNRDGQSNYYLNGSRCRRKDITDIFLGTGLGPRSYAIVEQGTISRLIEAKPHELRVFLEEAAGISRYKERRKETEQRMEHTRENLTRVFDVREELTKQVAHLERQAKSAEKYKQYKTDERLWRGQLLSLRCLQLEQELGSHQKAIETLLVEINTNENQYETLTENLQTHFSHQQEAQQSLEQAQQAVAEMDATIRLTEQNIQHNQTQQEQITNELKLVLQQQNESERLTTLDNSNLEQLHHDLSGLEEELARMHRQLTEYKKTYEDALQKQKNWQAQWQEINTELAKASQAAQVEQTRMQQMEQRLQHMKSQQQKLQEEQKNLTALANPDKLNALNEQLSNIEATRNDAHSKLQEHEATLKNLHAQLQQQIDTVYELRRTQQQLEGKLSSLQTLQQGAQAQQGHHVLNWLKEHQLDKTERLIDTIEMENGFDIYLENYLGEKLQAIVMQDWSMISSLADKLPKGTFDVILNACHPERSQGSDNNALLSHKLIKAPDALRQQLANVYYAENFANALALLETLPAHAEIITQDGLLLRHGWLEVRRGKQDQSGVLQRKRDITDLQTQLTALENTLIASQQKQKDLDAEIQAMETTKKSLYQTWQAQDQAWHQCRAQIQVQQSQLEQTNHRLKALTQELTQMQNDQQHILQEHAQAKNIWDGALAGMEKYQKQRDRLASEQELLEDEVAATSVQWRVSEEKTQQLQLKQQRLSTEQEGLKVQQERTHWQQQKLEERKQSLQQQQLSLTPALIELQKKITEFNEQKRIAINTLEEVHARVQSISQNLRRIETERQQYAEALAKFRDAHTKHQVEASQAETKAQGLLEQLQELELDFTTISQQLPEAIDVAQLQEQLDEVVRRIERLGAINLAAIEELTEKTERKTYFDTQYNDLTEALNTLQEAIREIDKETQAKFKETFDTVNKNFQSLFPKIFGGGQAYLSLVSEDLLDTGVLVFAQPPGKRNSTIHLLSGGEKALTALALVFGIFELNPAPFCMLDEVDAPLDDVNVGRFCNLVTAMAEKTQFIVVTHNKVAMEMGDQLLGVTMHEPGVSRLVSVDVEAAMAMAE